MCVVLKLITRLSLAIAVNYSAAAFAESTDISQGCNSYDQFAQKILTSMSKPELPEQPGGKNVTDVPLLDMGQAYDLQLTAQGRVDFMTAPGRHTLDEGAFAGMVRFKTASSGVYRLYISDGSWVDLLAEDGEIQPSIAFNGRHECYPLRKYVEYILAGNEIYTIQFSGGSNPDLIVAVKDLR